MQISFDELGIPLRDVVFVVVDLETTGGSPASSGITEIGAVKIRGGEVLGELHTLVNPRELIPPFIAVLTGITDAMVATAPHIETVLPTFLDFARGCVLVAHNAPFDLGFLKAGCESLGIRWPGFDSIDTARLARRVLTSDEAPNCKLSTLARVLHASVQPTHRALDDARATVDVLHVLFERLGSLGVHSLDELRTFTGMVTPQQRSKRHLADAMPHSPGVYMFRDQRGRVLYVGKAKDLRARVRSYFTSSEMRQRIVEMVAIAHDVSPIVCATDLEAQVRELRLIAHHKPPYNRRSKFPERSVWVKLTVEPFPRLSIVRSVKADAGSYLGPFSSSRSAELAVAALHEAVPLRQCRMRLNPRRPVSACALAEMGRCGAPCDGRESIDDYARHVGVVRDAIERDARPIVATMLKRIDALSAMLRYEDAAAQRDRLGAFVRAAARGQRLSALAGCAQLVAARPTAEHGYEVAVIRFGRLAAAGTIPPGVPPRAYVDALIATAETVLVDAAGPTACATAEEIECVLRWLESPGTRLVEVDGSWSCPAYGAGSQRLVLDFALELASDQSADPFADRRALRPMHRPARAS